MRCIKAALIGAVLVPRCGVQISGNAVTIERNLQAAVLLPSAFAVGVDSSFRVARKLGYLPDIRMANRFPSHDAVERVPRADAAPDARARGTSRATDYKDGKTGQDERSSASVSSTVNDISRLTRLLLPLCGSTDFCSADTSFHAICACLGRNF